MGAQLCAPLIMLFNNLNMQNRWLLIICTFIYLLLYYILHTQVFDAQLFQMMFENSSDETNTLYDIYNKISCFIILIATTSVLIRLLVVSLLMYGSYSVAKETFKIRDIQFASFLKCTLYAESAYILQHIVQLYRYINEIPSKISDFSKVPLSLYSLMGSEEMEGWMIYSLNTLNLFEVVYCVILMLSFKKTMKLTKKDSFNLLTLTYFPILLLNYILRIGIQLLTM